jgi:hypothetical protein
MGLSVALEVRLHGAMSEERLAELRRRLGLEHAGRLSDDEDAQFGHRYLRRPEGGGIVVLHLYRRSDTDWALRLGWQGEPLPVGTVDQVRSQALEAAAAMGLAASEP